MIKYVSLLSLFIISFVLENCNYVGSDCSVKEFEFAGKKYQAKGCLNNNLENGEWFFYDDKKQLTETGFYNNGARVGKWHYPQNKIDSIIVWKKYENMRLGFRFNIPAFVELVEDSLDYVKFSNKDSSKLFNIVFSAHDIRPTKKTIDNYYQQSEEEILSKGWRFNSIHNMLTTSEHTFYFNDYTIFTPKDSFKVLNLYTSLDSDRVMEVTCRYDISTEESARLIFFSLLTSVFHGKQRIVNPFSKIKEGRIH